MRLDQLTFGSVVFIADYVPLDKQNVHNKRFICTMRPAILDDNRLIYVATLGLAEVDPVPITNNLIRTLPDLESQQGSWAINQTEFTLNHSTQQGLYTISAAGRPIFQLHYIHQLQLAYSILFNAELDVSALLKALAAYRSPQRDT